MGAVVEERKAEMVDLMAEVEEVQVVPLLLEIPAEMEERMAEVEEADMEEQVETVDNMEVEEAEEADPADQRVPLTLRVTVGLVEPEETGSRTAELEEVRPPLL